MVLVELQRKFRQRQMKHSVFINFNPVPFGQNVEDCQQKREPGFKTFPHPMMHFLRLTHSRKQRKDRFDHHSLVPRAALADFDVLRVALLAVKASVGANYHFADELSQQRMKIHVRNICRRSGKTADLSEFIQHHTEFAADNPPRIGLAFLAQAFSFRKAQFSRAG